MWSRLFPQVVGYEGRVPLVLFMDEAPMNQRPVNAPACT